MKDQYFGDINDYRKYGLMRCIIKASDVAMLVAWMLTPDDSSSDGKFIAYLQNPEMWEKYDPELFQTLHNAMNTNNQRRVSLMERTHLLPGTDYFSAIVPDSSLHRQDWFDQLCKQARKFQMVFLDPDNGLEIKSRPYGTKNSCKFVYWNEIETLWNQGKSLLIYQHFIREKRISFIQRKLSELQEKTPGSLVEAFSTSHVVFLLALQPMHQKHHVKIVNNVQQRWETQIQHWDLVRNPAVDTVVVQ